MNAFIEPPLLSFNCEVSDSYPKATVPLHIRTNHHLKTRKLTYQQKKYLVMKAFENAQSEEERELIYQRYKEFFEDQYTETHHTTVTDESKTATYRVNNGQTIYIDVGSFKLKSNSQALIKQNDINFGELNHFHKIPDTTIASYDNRDYYFRDVSSYCEKEIFETFISFSLYSIKSYREGLRRFPCYEKFMLSFDKQLQTNDKFREKLLTKIVNGKEVLQFIKSEAHEIRSENIALRQEEIISNRLEDIRNNFEEVLKYSDKKEILKQRLDAIEQTLNCPIRSTKEYLLTPEAERLLTKLQIDENLFKNKTGTIADHQLQQEFVTSLIKAAELHDSTTSQHIKLGVESAVDFLKTGAQLNETQKNAAYSFSDAATDLLSFFDGVKKSFGDNVKAIGKFFEDPLDSTITKLKDLYNLAHTAVISAAKALIYTIINIPDYENSFYQLEMQKAEPVAATGKEIRLGCNHLMKTLNDMPRDEKFRNAGYIISDIAFNHVRGNVTSKILSLNKSNIKEAISCGTQTLKKLGKVGQEVASVIGQGVQKGLSSTKAILDYLKDQPEFALAQGGIYKFSADLFDKNKKFVNGLKEANKTNARINNYYNQTSEQLIKSLKAMQKQIEEHLNKINEFKINPEAFDNKGLLKNVSENIRKKMIEGRIKHWETEINGFKKNVNEIEKILKNKL